MLISQSKNFSKWYNDVILASGLAEYSPVRGCMVIKPYGYALWENIQKNLDLKIKEAGVKNAYFPLFIPESFLKKEAEHVKGFAPEVAWVTHGGKKKLQERLAVRPTSETIMYSTFSKWIKSYRNLPLRINQWANIVRWEMRPRLFLRTLEFLWQEGHTVHETKKEADKEAKDALDMYYDLARDYLAIHSIRGEKTESEKFAGALYTLTIEALMCDGKALQMGTSHNLGQNFSKSFGIKFLDKGGKEKYAWQTSWGVSTRLIGGLIMAHGDDKGLVLPPRLAPIQIVIIPIWTTTALKNIIKKYILRIEKEFKIKGIRFETDWREEQTPGWKFNEWELKGVPIRIEIGPNEIKDKKVSIFMRDNLTKTVVSLSVFLKEVEGLLKKIQKRMLKKSKDFTRENIHQATTFAEFKKIVKNKGGFVKAFWCGSSNCENKIQEDTKATVRCIPSRQGYKTGECVKCGKKSRSEVLFAKAY